MQNINKVIRNPPSNEEYAFVYGGGVELFSVHLFGPTDNWRKKKERACVPASLSAPRKTQHRFTLCRIHIPIAAEIKHSQSLRP